MARYMKIPQYFGQASSLLYYNSKCQYDTLSYYKRIQEVEGVKTLYMDGTYDYIVAKFDTNTGWFPQVGASVFLKFYIPENTDLYSKNFGIFGSGDSTDIDKNDFWGLYVRTDPSSGSKIFFVTVSNLHILQDVPFRGFTFSPTTFAAGKFHSIALVQNSTYAQLYADGLPVAKASLPFIPETNASYNNIYLGKYGNTGQYNGMPMYVKEIGLWQRPIEARDVLDLHSQNLIENKSVSSSAKRIKIEAGKFYYDGFIHNIGETSLFINGKGTETVYIIIKETLVTEEDDSSLLDNSANTYNLGKPGMHRIKFEYSYATGIDTSSLEEGTYAVKFLEFEDGVKTFSLLDSDTEEIESSNSLPSVTDTVVETAGKKNQTPTTLTGVVDSISTYLYEMMGNFIYNGLSVSMLDKDLENYQVNVGPGIYYLNGVRYEIDKNTALDVAKSNSLTSIVNEYIPSAPLTPILLSQQPVAAKYISNGLYISGVTRALVPAIYTKTITVTRTDRNGEDVIDASAIKVLNVYKGSSLGNASVVYNPCSTLDGSDGDYYFYNGRIKWSPNATNKPTVAAGGIATDWYVVEYAKYYACEEGVNNDFIVIKGDRYTVETITYKGRSINHALLYNPEYVISARIISSSGNYSLSTIYITLSDQSFRIDGALEYLNPGDTIEIYYSYNSVQSVKATWHLVWLENGNKTIDTTTNALVDYKYYLTDIYTLTIDVDNVFRLYRGTPGYNGNAVKSSIPSSSLPIADILVDPDGSEYCTISSYDIYKMHVSDIRNLSKKVNDLEENIILSELEKTAEGKSDLSVLKGMYVDSMSNYSRMNLVNSDAFIDLIRQRLYSGFEKSSYELNLGNASGKAKIGREVYYPLNNFNNKIIESQHSITGSVSVNGLLLSEVGAQVSVYNDFSYIQELENVYTKNALNALGLSQLALIPYNSETSVYNISYANDTSTVDRSSNINRALEKFKLFFDGTILNTILNNRVIVLVGKGFTPNEQNITLSINGTLISAANLTPLTVDTTGGNYSVQITENGTVKNFSIPKLNLASGWSIDNAIGIKCNSSGEFVVSLLLQYSLNLVTGSQNLVFSRYYNPNDPVTIKLNLNGLLDSLKNVINTGFRGTIGAYDCDRYSSSYVPGIIQPIGSYSATILGVNLYFDYIDYSSPILIDFYEMNGSAVKKVLYRKYITAASDFNVISGTKYTLIFDFPVNVVNSKSYGIGICTGNSSIRCSISEVGQPSTSSEDKNVIVSRVKSYYSISSLNNAGEYYATNDGKKGLVYDLLALDISTSSTNNYGYVESTIKFDSLQFAEEQDRFFLYCDLDPTIGYDRKISIEYSIDDADMSDSAKTWTKITPYTLVTPSEKFNTLTFRFVLSSGNKNYFPCIPQHPVVNVYKFKEESSYLTKTFESGIEDGNGEPKVKIYFDSEYRPNSEYTVTITPDGGITWRDVALKSTSVNGQTTSLVLQSQSYQYDCKLMNPIILGHELIDPVSGSLTNGNFGADVVASYMVALLDDAVVALTPNEVYNINSDTKLPEVYTVVTGAAQQKIKLQIQIDATCKGFRVYRALNGSDTYRQIYSSTAMSYVPSSISASDIDPYLIPVNDTSEFPTKGYLLINNELIKYDGIQGNMFVVSDNGRGYYNTTVATVRPGDKVALYDYAIEHESILSGQVPRIYNGQQYFEFVDDYQTYREYSGRTAKSESERSENNSVSYPSELAVKITFNNSSDITESSSIWDLICNVESE